MLPFYHMLQRRSTAGMSGVPQKTICLVDWSNVVHCHKCKDLDQLGRMLDVFTTRIRKNCDHMGVVIDSSREKRHYNNPTNYRNPEGCLRIHTRKMARLHAVQAGVADVDVVADDIAADCMVLLRRRKPIPTKGSSTRTEIGNAWPVADACRQKLRSEQPEGYAVYRDAMFNGYECDGCIGEICMMILDKHPGAYHIKIVSDDKGYYELLESDSVSLIRHEEVADDGLEMPQWTVDDAKRRLGELNARKDALKTSSLSGADSLIVDALVQDHARGFGYIPEDLYAELRGELKAFCEGLLSGEGALPSAAGSSQRAPAGLTARPAGVPVPAQAAAGSGAVAKFVPLHLRHGAQQRHGAQVQGSYAWRTEAR